MDGIIKDRNRKDVTEVEEVKRCKNTEKNYGWRFIPLYRRW